MKLLARVLFAGVFISPLLAQPCSTVVVPVVLGTEDGRLVRNVPADGFVVNVRNKPALVEAASYGSTPQRILLVLDTNPEMKEHTWTILSAVAEDILEHADFRDSFALLTARGSRVEVRFGESHTVLLDKLKELSAVRSRKEFSRPGTLDAALEGTSWFGTPQPGDSIMLLAEDVYENYKTDPDRLGNQLRRKQIRLFAFLAGHLGIGGSNFLYHYRNAVEMHSGRIPQGPYEQIPFTHADSFEVRTLPQITYGSGGYVMHEDTIFPGEKYELTPWVLEFWKARGRKMYDAIANTHFLRVRPPAPRKKYELEVGVTNSVKKKVSLGLAMYPREVQCEAN